MSCVGPVGQEGRSGNNLLSKVITVIETVVQEPMASGEVVQMREYWDLYGNHLASRTGSVGVIGANGNS